MTGVYNRVSSEDQAQNLTIELERVENRRFCEARGWSVDLYEDNPVSGDERLEDRTAGARLLKDLAAGKLDRVVIWHSNRLGRTMPVLVLALAEIEKYVPVESTMQGPLSWKDPEKILMTAVHFGMASADKAQFLYKTKTASRNLAAGEMWMGGVAPYGFKQVGLSRAARLEPSTERISPVCKYSEAEVIAIIFERAAAGDSCAKIADHLNNILGIPPAYADRNRDDRRGGGTKRLQGNQKERKATTGAWWPAHIRSIITSSVYRGEHIWGKRRFVRRGEDGKRHWPAAPREQWITRHCTPLISPELWARANASLVANRIEAMARSPKREYLLRGLIRCQFKAHAHPYTFTGITTTQKNGTMRVYYRCASRYGPTRHVRHDCCTTPGLDSTALEAEVWAHIRSFLTNPGAVKREVQKQMEAAAGKDTLGGSIEELVTARKRNEDGRNFLIRQARLGNITEEQFEREMQSSMREDKELARRLEEKQRLLANEEARALSLNQMETHLESLAEKDLDSLSFAERRAYVLDLVEAIAVEPTEGGAPKITVTYKFEPHERRWVQSLKQWNGKEWDYPVLAGNATARRASLTVV
jgi:site-specific DNA recombinase